MTLRLAPEVTGAIALDACVAGLEEMRLDPDDEASWVEAAPWLGALAADRTFLGDILVAELALRARTQERANDYGAQVVMLHRGPGWFVRANIWPHAGDPLLRDNGARRFFYGVPHDHNFTFLTVGYLGPGYWSDYYDYDHAAVAGVPGEHAGLRFVERAALGEGQIMLYRAHRDVHDQHPPDATSVSLNIVQSGTGRSFSNQYRFDLARGTIAGQLAHSATESLMALLPELGGDAGRDLLDRFAAHHPCDRVRFGAIATLAGAAPDLARRRTILERAAGQGNRTVAGLARHRLDELDAGADWIGATVADHPIRSRA